MKNKFFTRITAFMLVFCILILTSCSLCVGAVYEMEPINNIITNNEMLEINNNQVVDNADGSPNGEYKEGFVLVKYTGDDENVFAELDIKSAELLYEGSSWYYVELNDSTKTVEMVQELAALEIFDYVNYDYIMATDAEIEHVGIGNNPNYNHNQKKYFETHKVQQGWEYLQDNNINPGGSADVVVAVIDTGVDYNHLDLRNNIWTNPAEIPDNGKDDDGNGYIDDVYGWDCVGNDNDPMDDNGHGTHVAGIVAAENNGVGGVGVAFNCKIMVIKAGNSSGYFNNSDIAEAIQYAYMNGASVINMSFGGSNISIAVEEALEEAYNTCILVAAAGNDGKCNQPGCALHEPMEMVKVSYPAALPYVIGVMSVGHDGKHASSFSNYDHYPYNEYEYEVYAVGESVYSTWPNNKYATLKGTSMAAPMVAGIAALLRSYYSDREVYATKYIQSQIVNTGTVNPYNAILQSTDYAHSVVNSHEALTKFPTPEVNLYDYRIDDSTSISANNNGNGVIDAGETVRLYISLHNRGGVATDVNVTIDTIRNGDASITDPYFTLVNTSMSLSDIGTYSVREPYENQFFEIIVDENCPDRYICDFNIRFTYENGLNDNDNMVYSGVEKVQLSAMCSGVYLPNEISNDITLTNDKLYYVDKPVFIKAGVTVTINEGVKIQKVGGGTGSGIYVEGRLILIGTNENRVCLKVPVEKWTNDAYVNISYAEIYSSVEADVIDHCICDSSISSSIISNSVITYYASSKTGATQIVNCVFPNPDFKYWGAYQYKSSSIPPYDRCVFYTPYYSYAAFRLNMFAPESTNALLNSDVLAKPLIHNVNGLQGSSIVRDYLSIYAPTYNKNLSVEENTYSIGSIYWGTSNQKIIDSYFYDFYDDPCWAIIDKSNFLDTAPEDVWPFVTNVRILNKNDEEVNTVSKEEVTFIVEFNRDMDTTVPLSVKFGSVEPYADYVIKGEFISPKCWAGKYTLKSYIENGTQYININNGRASDDHFMELYEVNPRFKFNIDTTEAMSMDLIANPTSKGVELTWVQDDHDTLMGYNIYRATSENGSYTKINPSVILDAYSTFTDTNVEAGKTYWYTFTVVLSDFTESKAAGQVSATAIDSIPPQITHTPITQGYLNNNLNISCTVTDNVEVSSVMLYYRTIGETEWRTLNMSKSGTKYSATIYGSQLALAGLEYYIAASDGLSDGFSGDSNTPYRVDIKHASRDHDSNGGMFSDETGHWHTCSVCGEKGTVSSHTPGAAPTETTPQTCTECGFVIRAALGHTHQYGTEYKTNNYMHWRECSCGAQTDIAEHIFDNLCDSDCNECGYYIARNHTYDNNCDMRCNRCDEMRVTEHTFDDGVVTKEPTTTKYGEMMYTCTECGEKRYEDIDMLEDDGQNPDNDQNSNNKPNTDNEPKPDDKHENKGGCYIATSVYGSYDCPQVWTLRRFRDNILGKTWIGRLFIRTYYAISPTLVKWFGETRWFKNMWKGTLDRMVNRLNERGVEDTPYDDIDW